MDHAPLSWDANNVPVSEHFDDPYFSRDDGLAETRHVFLAGNDLPNRFAPGFHIAELGFGTGLNFLAALKAFLGSQKQGRLYFTSFEAYPLTQADFKRALAGFDGLPTDILTEDPLEEPRITGDRFELHLIYGDARQTLPDWTGKADAWFLDGFSPAKNPEMWTPTLLQSVADHTRPGGTCATYTAAGAVRHALTDAGFEVTRSPGYGRKRHMTIGRLK